LNEKNELKECKLTTMKLLNVIKCDSATRSSHLQLNPALLNCSVLEAGIEEVLSL